MNEVNDYNCRTALLLGDDSVGLLARSHVLVVGTGGVGSYAVEAVARAGVGRITMVDADTVAPSNINRQLPGPAFDNRRSQGRSDEEASARHQSRLPGHGGV